MGAAPPRQLCLWGAGNSNTHEPGPHDFLFCPGEAKRHLSIDTMHAGSAFSQQRTAFVIDVQVLNAPMHGVRSAYENLHAIKV